MKKVLWISIAIFLLALIIGCSKETPTGLYVREYTGKSSPVITSVTPPNSALAGIVEVTITGENFSPNLTDNIVYFGKNKARMVSASPTQLKVVSPNVISDSLMIKVAVQGALSFSNSIRYKLLQGIAEYGEFTDFDDPYVLACDKDENLFVAGFKVIYKITPDGKRENYATTTLTLQSSMKIGPDGALYIARLANPIYRISPGGGASEVWFRAAGRIYDIDFAPGGFMYAGGKGNDLYLIQPDASSGAAVASYPSTYIKAVRVFDGYVYVAGRDETANKQYLWRNKIQADNTLGANEILLDWEAAGMDNAFDILSIAIAQDGDIYLGTNAPEAIVIVHPDRTLEPLYPGVLEPETYAMNWGTGDFLYVCRRNEDVSKKRVLRINMLKKGAPDYGRD